MTVSVDYSRIKYMGNITLLLLHIFFRLGLYSKTHIQSVYSAIRKKLKPG